MEKNPFSLKRILLVDDDQSLLEMVGETLRLTNYEVTTASSGEEALRLCTHEKFGCVITDLMMPKPNGLELIRELRSLIRCPRRIVLMSASSDPVDLGGETTTFLAKPFEARQLLTTLQDLLTPRIVIVHNDENLARIVTETLVTTGGYQIELVPNPHALFQKPAAMDILIVLSSSWKDGMTSDDVVSYSMLHDGYPERILVLTGASECFKATVKPGVILCVEPKPAPSKRIQALVQTLLGWPLQNNAEGK